MAGMRHVVVECHGREPCSKQQPGPPTLAAVSSLRLAVLLPAEVPVPAGGDFSIFATRWRRESGAGCQLVRSRAFT